MTEGMRAYLAALSPREAEKLRRDSLAQLARALPHRERSGEARIQCETNERMLANLDALGV